MKYITRRGMNIDMGEEVLTKQTPKIHLNYTSAKFHRRVLANLTDFIIFSLVFVGLFLSCREITVSTSSYKEKASEYLTLRLESGLYMPKEGDCQDTVAYLSDSSNNYSGYAKKNLSKEAIDKFFVFAENRGTSSIIEEIQKDYDSYRLAEGFAYEGVSYFVKQDGQIIENEACQASLLTWFERVYAPYINNHLHGYLNTRFPEYISLVRYETNTLIWAEIVPAYMLSGVLTYLVPPIFFRRGRRTLGKAMYRIGLADKRLLNCSFPRFLARFSIWYFAELCLSPFTFGIPYIISFSLMAFSKKKQGFPDYMLRLYEIDLTNDKLYFDYAEIAFDQTEKGKKATTFNPIYPD